MKKEDFIVNTPIITIPKETQPEKLFILGKEFDCSNIEELVDKVKAFEIISKAYGDYANHKISEYELIMIVGKNITY